MSLPKVEVLQNKFWKVEVTATMLSWATKKADYEDAKWPHLHKPWDNTLVRGSLQGCVGEAAALNCYRMSEACPEEQHGQFDFRHLGKRIDAKTRCVKKEEMHFVLDFLLDVTDIKHTIDAFLFCSTTPILNYAIVLGWLPREEVLKQPCIKKGQVPPKSKTPLNSDAYNITIGALRAPKELWEWT